MCGILGGINTDFDDQSLQRLRHRGPDQARLVSEKVPEHGTVTLGQTRLNIIDRHDISLPVRIGTNAIVFNGEIYNYIELRTELEQLGWCFATKTDTEVALAAYLQWGTACLDRFNGMFALAVWDGQRFFCARDRMGQKPLFYRYGPGKFEFASEIKAFSNLQFVSQEVFDLLEFCPNEHTLYRDIFSLRPGSYLIYDLARGTCHTRSYWDIEHQISRRIDSREQAVNGFIELLEDAVRLRLRADVPVTLFLSGGIDSALIATLSNVEEAFTCQFDEFAHTINEERYASDLAERLGLRLHIVRPTREQFLHDLPAMAYHLELPTGSFSVFPLYRLAQACQEAGYKVVLSGEGADELFGGYVRNELLMRDSQGTVEDMQLQYASMLNRYHGSDLDRFCRMASRSGLSGAAQMKMYLAGDWSDCRSQLENICYVESRIFLQPLLQMGDRMCMAHGVEGRCPFLDYRIVEFAFSLADSLRYCDGTGKWLVNQAAQKLLPPGSLTLQRPVKHGLPTPVNLWLQGRHSFDRRYWNTLMTAECMKALLGVQRIDAVADAVKDRHSILAKPAQDSRPAIQLTN